MKPDKVNKPRHDDIDRKLQTEAIFGDHTCQKWMASPSSHSLKECSPFDREDFEPSTSVWNRPVEEDAHSVSCLAPGTKI